MSVVDDVAVGAFPPERFRDVLSADRFARFEAEVERARRLFEGRVVWNVNSTAQGGGVAEMLRSLLAYARGAGIDARWAVIHGNPDFFRVTKRIHNNLHGAPGDGGDLGPDEAAVYRATLAEPAAELAELVRPDDVVIVHDPQPAGIVGRLRASGAVVVWRCHVGLDLPSDVARRAWRFLIPHVRPADAYVFSRAAFAWEGLDRERVVVIPPSIDAFSPKNQELDDGARDAILAAAGIVSGAPDGAAPTFVRHDGTPGRVDRRATLVEDRPLPYDAPAVVQVSRWDRLKDPIGVMEGFARHADAADAHLVLAGPAVEAVSDDPEGAEVLRATTDAWRALPARARARVHLAALPMDDGEENAAIVNALQRHARVAVQKSLAEGFGLTVAEAMWKARPVVASRIGGIQDQIVDGVSGVLVDPADLGAFGAAVTRLLADGDTARRIGREAQERVRDEFLAARHLMQYVGLVASLLARR
ncbi:MAG TPA: glycosyltransferase [Actinomycetota bacterium]|nr:glycosyltransferase [Actinomycetota bacterium]